MKKSLLKLTALLLLTAIMIPNIKVFAEEKEYQLEEEIEYIIIENDEDSIFGNIYIIISPFAESPSGYIRLDKYSGYINIQFSAGYTGSVPSEIGFKDIFIRVRDTNSSLYTSQQVANICDKNTRSFSRTLKITNPVAGKSYQVVANAYVIIDGVEYKVKMESDDWLDY